MDAISLFTGIGGIDLAFENNGFNIIWANEYDAKANETFRSNFNINILNSEDIRDINAKDIPNHEILLAGFPCQSFSLAGYRKGFKDSNGELFFNVLNIIKAKKPKIIFLENVKNLVSHDNGNTFNVINKSLKNEGYTIKFKVLNSSEYGNIPQNRERIYIIGFKNKAEADRFYFPDPLRLSVSLSSIIGFNEKIEEKFYYNEKKFKHYSILKRDITKKKSIYQWRRKYVRENKSGVCPTLTANMGTGGHNVPIIKDKYGIRKLTPRECFSLQGFPDTFKLPDIANSHLYKQAGNSVTVPVIERIAKNIKTAIQ